MSFDVIHELLVAKFAKSLIVYPTREWLPFEVEEMRSIRLLPGCEVLRHRGVHLCHQPILLLVVV